MRSISFALTIDQIVNGTKDVTRRLGWKNLKPGDRLQAVDKAMGFPKGSKAKDHQRVLGIVEVVSVRRERLDLITSDEVRREGFPGKPPVWFVQMFSTSMRCAPDTEVTRIEFRMVTK